MFAGAAAWTTGVWAAVAETEPAPLAAVTTIRRVEPTSEGVSE